MKLEQLAWGRFKVVISVARDRAENFRVFRAFRVSAVRSFCVML
jgi:hypothetical protein